MNKEVLLRGGQPSVHPVVFADIDESMVKDAALNTKSSSGPSGLDADGWIKILVSKSYGTINSDSRRALSLSLKSSLLTQPNMKHHSKCFFLADSFPLTKTEDYDQLK